MGTGNNAAHRAIEAVAQRVWEDAFEAAEGTGSTTPEADAAFVVRHHGLDTIVGALVEDGMLPDDVWEDEEALEAFQQTIDNTMAQYE